MNQVWDTENYALNFNFVFKYGHDVIKLIEKEEGKVTLLDLGCGTGALTNVLSEEGFEVMGLDASEDMLNKARRDYPGIRFIHSDATNFELERPVDVIFSNAVLHWIDREKQPDMMRCVYNALNPGGQFIFEMGGHGNNKLIHPLLEELFRNKGFEYKLPFFFPSIGEYSELLEKAGFTVRYAILFDRPTPLMGDDGLAEWIKMFQKNQFNVMNEKNKNEIITETVDILRPKLLFNGIWYSDYVRLRMRAVKE